MYFPVRWPKYLALEGPVIQICTDYHRTWFAVLQPDSLSIWMEKNNLPLWCHRRSKSSLSTYGANTRVVWRRDSSALAIVTSKNHVFFYKIDAFQHPVYEQKDLPGALKRESPELYPKERINYISLKPAGGYSSEQKISAILSFRDELLIAQVDGTILRLEWDGQVQDDLTIDLKEVKFATEIYTWRGNFRNETYEVIDIQYLPLIGSLSMVFANGRAGLIMAMTNRFTPREVQGVWIMDVTKATCTAVNHRYRLIAYGLSNSEGVVYCLDDATVRFVLSHKLVLSDKDFPDVSKVAGPVKCIQWTPDNSVVAIAWENCGVAVWSVFGSLIFCSLNWESPYCEIQVCSMEWGYDGYNLWLGSNSQDLSLLSFMKAAATLNPVPQSDQQRIVLQGSSNVLISSKDALLRKNEPGSPWAGPSLENHSANKHWIHITVPHTYLALNGPIRYTCIDRDGSNLCVAGRGGFCLYSLQSKKWKFFGNETQEQDFMITGGVLWWSDFVLCGCINIKDPSDEIRLYPRDKKLDNSKAIVYECDAQVLHISTCEDKLLAFLSNSHINIFLMQRRTSSNSTTIELIRLENIDLSSLIPHCVCVLSATLTNLSVTTVPAYIQKRPESILLNVCGRLYLLQQDVSAATRRPSISPPSAESGECAYSNPRVLASGVENMWISNTSNQKMPHLTQALYIACGAAGMQIWLPLFPAADKQHNFMSKRIMLAIKVHIYPLAVLFNEAIVLGAESDISINKNLCEKFPHCIITKSSQVYLHPIINKLLFRNLGGHAWQIANSCNHLPYFNHSLELLLHEVLEEEANSSSPIPDALLPRVIDFIREFPVFLKTVVQCARKTELALWPHLFSAVGNPKDLFQECILQGQLETATSYLLVLQNLEVALVSRQHATILLGSALDAGKWELTKEIIRFLKAIGPSDVESPPRASLMPSLVPTGTKPVSVVKPDEDITMMMASMMGPSQRQRLSSRSDSISAEQKTPVQQKIAASRDESDVMNEAFIDVILSRYARKLLQSGQLRKFGHFISYLEFPYGEFLAKEKTKSATIEDYTAAIRNVHRDFELPYPVHVPGSDASTGSSESPVLHSNGVPLMLSQNVPRSSSLASDSGFTSIDAPLQPPSIATTTDNETRECRVRTRNAECDSLNISEAGSWQLDHPYDSHQATPGNNSPDAVNRKFSSIHWCKAERDRVLKQIAYLNDLFCANECYDWAIICSVVLNQPSLVVKFALRSSSHRQAVQILDSWAHKECAGYRPFFLSLFSQINRGLKLSLHPPALLRGGDGQILESPQEVSTNQPEPSKQRPASADSTSSEVLAQDDSVAVINRCKLRPLDQEDDEIFSVDSTLKYSMSQPDLKEGNLSMDLQHSRSVENFRQGSDYDDDEESGCVIQ